MKRTYLLLTIIGFILPNLFVAKVTFETGNILLYTKPLETLNQMFSNDVASAFIVDLLFIVVLFLIWSFKEAKKYNMKNFWWAWIFTFAFGIAGGLPFFLYLREKKKEQSSIA